MLIGGLPLFKGTLKQGIKYTVLVTSGSLETGLGIKETENTSLVILLVVIALTSFFALFLYKKQKLQLRFVALNFLLMGLSVFVMFQSYNQFNEKIGLMIHSTQYQPALFLPVVLVLLNVLAYRGIKKDIDLLASVDRLR